MGHITGYYRVNYDIRNWYKISNYLHSQKYNNIHVFNRAQIINDAFFFMMEENKEISGYLFINIMSYLSLETDYIAWYPLFRIITRLKKTLLLPELKNVKVDNNSFYTDEKHVSNIHFIQLQFDTLYFTF